MIKLILTEAVDNAVRFKLGETEIEIGHTAVDVTEATAKVIETQYPGWTQRVPVKGQTPTQNDVK